ncbi:cytoplasmic phosphatidylinositol transfer protein 1-like isoform X3 [Carassius auratus]|uniref:Cytoplasmic phosphatidylinositol transfer protein 1-like isoform X3 n=1 Tax=Carassius auratus TaxID=7957 RepID=A0A6P6LLE2_CARAU|nr:cytoplasmic phosphatidylinositol transfer protein 1-like isoform X3 [Carassius auratus]XP_052475014.1 cytoplasmic phosphatidylinositol transfer protein 1-like isoform X2 [Carassius gibelio]
MLMKEYRICMPLTVDEYKIGQLYMISKHSSEQSGGGEGVEVVRNEPCTDPKHGAGQMTEKRIYLNSKLPTWIRKFVPMVFYITETAWNFYPYTITEYTCSFLPRFHVRIETSFKNDNGCSENVFGDDLTPKDSVCFLDILSDPIPDKHYKKAEDLSNWVSQKTGRGPLVEGWRDTTKPIMCSYKRVSCSFEVYGFQGRTEDFIHRNIRDILLVGHRQAVAWIDEWHGMTIEQVREYEKKQQEETNSKLNSDITCTDSAPPKRPSYTRSISVTDESSLKKMGTASTTASANI